jgi:acyl-CoA reductase-like NAD-dependent aldehyde dehydrogenase
MTIKIDLTPIVTVDERQWSKVQGFIERATKNGFKSFDNSLQSMTEGHFVPATVFYNVPDDAEIATQEIFGPILCVLNP